LGGAAKHVHRVRCVKSAPYMIEDEDEEEDERIGTGIAPLDNNRPVTR